MVTPRVEASPDRSDFAKLGETIALEQTKQFADDIRSQVAEKSRELAEMNERLMAFCRPRIASFSGAIVQRTAAYSFSFHL